MGTILTPYLNFRDDAREAMEFYHSILGGELSMMRFGDFQVGGPEEADKVMHSQIDTPAGLTLMAADTPDYLEFTAGTNFSVSLSGEDAVELGGYFEKLAEGGEIKVPLGEAPWGGVFGMCTDRFDITWLVNVNPTADATADTV